MHACETPGYEPHFWGPLVLVDMWQSAPTFARYEAPIPARLVKSHPSREGMLIVDGHRLGHPRRSREGHTLDWRGLGTPEHRPVALGHAPVEGEACKRASEVFLRTCEIGPTPPGQHAYLHPERELRARTEEYVRRAEEDARREAERARNRARDKASAESWARAYAANGEISAVYEGSSWDLLEGWVTIEDLIATREELSELAPTLEERAALVLAEVLDNESGQRDWCYELLGRALVERGAAQTLLDVRALAASAERTGADYISWLGRIFEELFEGASVVVMLGRAPGDTRSFGPAGLAGRLWPGNTRRAR